MVFEKFYHNRWCCLRTSIEETYGYCQRYDLNRLLVDDGSCNRTTVNVKNIKLTDLSIKITHGARPGTVKKAWAAADIAGKWAKTDLAASLARSAKRASLGDFDRYKLMRLKQERSRIVKAELGRLRKSKK